MAAAGVPASVAVRSPLSVNVTPVGSAPVTVSVGTAPPPTVVTVKVPGVVGAECGRGGAREAHGTRPGRRGDRHAAGERRIEREVRAHQREVVAGPDGDERAGARPRHGEDLDPAVIGQVEGGDLHAARERGVVGEEAAELGEGRAVPEPDVRTAARARASDDVGQAIAVDVARGDVDAAGKERGVGEEAADLMEVRAAPDADVRAAARVPRR